MTLFETIDGHDFSAGALEMFARLAGVSPTDEAALVVLAAAAAILASDAVDEGALLLRCGEFSEVAEEMRLRFSDGPRQPPLLLVGGADFTPIQKEA